MNEKRINQIMSRPAMQVTPPGTRVRWRGFVGVIDAIYVDLQAAIDCGQIDDKWYEDQAQPPRSGKQEPWYSVIVPDGAVLIGHSDLVLA